MCCWEAGLMRTEELARRARRAVAAPGSVGSSAHERRRCRLHRHGDLLFLFPSSLAGPSSEMETSTAAPGPKAPGAAQVVEDEIDQYLSRQDGKIYRSRDPQL